ncbi:hypothetical protein LS633_03630 [Pseudomonas sp. NIBR-H-19]|uniref:hypothetical protein n=1 Tax=Pseudomonas sp. NIBR-H-19 TaxID=2901380 RepID=UPI001E46458F|nr:hypothetical protein [Pseudomonas sp. NIBR-H-19]UHC82929.1 hypothetical protein LS633_03630 [Pseudomonas sp. NIBR-H-19]
MSEDKETVSNMPSESTGYELLPPLQDFGDKDPDKRYWKPIQFPYPNHKLLFAPKSSDLTFNIPAYAGEQHQVWMNFVSSNFERKLFDGSWFYAVAWNTVQIKDLPEGPAYIDAQWRKGSEWAPETTILVEVRTPAAFDAVSVAHTTVSGTARQGSSISLFRPGNGSAALSDTATAGPNGRWTVNLLPSVPKGPQGFIIRENVPGTLSRWAEATMITVVSAAIHEPPIDGLLGDFRGDGMPGMTLMVLAADDHSFELSGRVLSDRADWYLQLKPNRPLVAGPLKIQLQFQYEGLPGLHYTTPRTVKVDVHPRITVPAANSTQPASFTIEGILGHFGAVVEILLDTGDVVGKSGVLTNGEWSVDLNGLEPGNKSFVTELVFKGVRYGRGAPVAFKIRPARTDDIKVEIIDKSITFSGTGYPGATVVITVPGSPVSLPQPVVAADGKWEIKATDLPLGKLAASILQKVSDNASGWIESLPYNFEINNSLPDVYAVSSTDDYQPTFSGKGFTGATVKIFNPGGGSQAAPEVVVRNGEWQSKASQQWGPTLKREVHIKQYLDRHQSLNWVKHPVTIAPQAPTIELPVEEGLSPTFSGTCWPGAVVTVSFSDDATTYPATENAGTWAFRRPTSFVPDVTHAITVTQTVVTLTSPPATEDFTVLQPMLQPLITHPAKGSSVGRDITVMGSKGMKGATMQLFNEQFGRPIGDAKVLVADGEWSIDLMALDFGLCTLSAQQTLNNRPSLKSDPHAFTVVLLPPLIEVPMENGDLPRISRLSGLATAGAKVQVLLQGSAEPLLSNVTVDAEGHWEGEVTLPVGAKVIRARQFFAGKTSEDSRPLSYNVVPAAPYIETPVIGEHVGRRVVVSGFGIAGDTVTVRCADTPQSTVVLSDRSWSVTYDFGSLIAGQQVLLVEASLDIYTSAAAQRPFELRTFKPTIDEPEAGRWVSHPVAFAGQGRAGSGEVVSWYNPDITLVKAVPVVDGKWRGESTQPLPETASWCRFRQTLIDSSDGATSSDWTDSSRYEVEPAPLSRKRE